MPRRNPPEISPPPENQVVWSNHAQQWSRLGSPLRPSARDGEIMWQMIRDSVEKVPGGCRIVLLGVTPELVGLPWPADAELLAIDKSPEMIATVWDPNARIHSQVQPAWWQAMPLAEGWADTAIGDGSFNALPALEDWTDVFEELARVLKPHGKVVARVYVRPDAREHLPVIVSDTLAGRIGILHALKWRLAMALVGGADAGVAVADIHKAFERHFPDRAALAQNTGWPQETIATIDAYRGMSTRYTFPTRAEIATACAGIFTLAESQAGDYELGERCPTMAFHRVPA